MPLVERTLEAHRISVFCISQLNKDSVGCLIFETALENRSLAALSLCLIISGTTLMPFTGVYIIGFFSVYKSKNRFLDSQNY